MEFRLLNADEIECRVSTVSEKGVSLLLYKDARCDMNILDETVGAERWQRRHEIIGGNLYCNVGIKFDDEWIWKQDVGVESYTEKEKEQIEKERLLIEAALKHENIKLFSFNSRTDITTDLNNYSDDRHYGFWINSLMLKWMKDGKYQITWDNYEQYLANEYNFYSAFDFNDTLSNQEDYVNDYLAPAILRKELTGIEPYVVAGEKYSGERITISNTERYKYLVLYDVRLSDGDLGEIRLYDETGTIVKSYELDYNELNAALRLHVYDIGELNGKITVELSQVDRSQYVFSNIALY